MVDSFHVIASKRSGGAERFFMRLVEALNETGHEAVAVIRCGSMISQNLNITVRQIRLGMYNNNDLFSALKLRRYVNMFGPLIVQSYMSRATRLTHITPGKGVIHVARLGGFYRIQGYYRHAHAWVGNTKAVCDYMVREGLPADRVFLIGNFVDIPEYTPTEKMIALRKSLGIPKDAIIIFSLSRFIRKKGIDNLLTAFSKLPVEVNHRSLRLIIAGDGPQMNSLKALGKVLGLKDRIIWAGWVNKPDIYFDIADIFVCPSQHEPLGNVILEAWAHKLPVLATPTDGTRELIINGYNGILSGENNPQNLSNRILELLQSDQKEWNRIGSNGMRSLVDAHSKHTVINRYLELYDELHK